MDVMMPTVNTSNPRPGTIQIHVVDNTPDTNGCVMINITFDDKPIWFNLTKDQAANIADRLNEAIARLETPQPKRN